MIYLRVLSVIPLKSSFLFSFSTRRLWTENTKSLFNRFDPPYNSMKPLRSVVLSMTTTYPSGTHEFFPGE
jgi:hypothetical protein